MKLDMKLFRRIFVSSLLFAAVPVISAADEPHHHGAAPEKLGTVLFPTSCSAAAQPKFVRGVALLHSFWYDEAERTFREVTVADPSCGMGWWGVAMTNFHPIWAVGNPGAEPTPAELANGREAARKALEVGAKTQRERDYIAAVAAYYESSETLPHTVRIKNFETASERVYRNNPTDREAAVFYALAILGTVSPADKTYATQKKAAEILNRVLPEMPDHPGVAHYMIHSFDYPPLAELALPAAKSYAKIAPDAPHALHMPSHIFTRLGLWDDSIQSNLASSAAARRYVARMHPGAMSFDDLHAQDYLEYAYLQKGQDAKARAVVEDVAQTHALDVPNFAAAYALAAIPGRFVVERRKWNEGAALALRPEDFPWAKFRTSEALLHFAKALAAARSKNVETARAELGRLEEIGKTLAEKKDAYWAGQVEIARLEAAAWIARAEEKPDEAVRLARSAADLEDSTDKHPVTPGAIVPARELFADMLLDLGRPAEALKEYQTALVSSPNRFNGLYGAGRAAKLAGDGARARGYFEKLVAMACDADGRREELAEARGLLASK